MKIAFVRKRYTPYGGAERYLSQLIRRLCQTGHEVHIYAHRWDESDEERTRVSPGPVFHRVPMIGPPSFLEAWSFAFFSKRLLEKADYDIVHSFERTLFQDVYRAGDGCHREWLYCRKRMESWGKRLLLPINPLHRTILALEKRLFHSPRLKKIIANSERGKNEICRHYQVVPEKIHVIYNGVDLEFFHPRNRNRFRKAVRAELGLPEDAPVALFLGSGFRRKGLDSLLSAFSQVVKNIPEAFLLVAGKDRTAKYVKQVGRMDLGERVRFLGPTGRARELYAASDLFALPTVYDPFSNACMEAMATGIPVVTSRVNGVAEIIEEGKNGMLIGDPLNVEEIADRILSLFAAPDREFWGERARQTSLGFDLDSAVEQMLKIYEQIRQ